MNQQHRPQLGDRVSVRYRHPAVGLTDVIGVVIAIDDSLSLRDRHGITHQVEYHQIVAWRVVPPIPGGPDPQKADPELIALASALTWYDRLEPLGDWLLRTGAGHTRRANSALAIGDPGCPWDTAASQVRAFYQLQGTRPQAQVIIGSDADLALAELGWTASGVTLVMVARLADVARPEAAELRLSPNPAPEWQETYLAGRQTPGPSLQRILVSGNPIFAEHPAAGVAIGRGSIARTWLTISALWVAPPQRRRGIMSQLVRKIAGWAGNNDARSALVQVAADNLGAIAGYERLGFREHHRYHYRQPLEP